MFWADLQAPEAFGLRHVAEIREVQNWFINQSLYGSAWFQNTFEGRARCRKVFWEIDWPFSKEVQRRRDGGILNILKIYFPTSVTRSYNILEGYARLIPGCVPNHPNVRWETFMFHVDAMAKPTLRESADADVQHSSQNLELELYGT